MVEPEANPFSGIMKLFQVFSNQTGTCLVSQDLFPDSTKYNLKAC